MEATGNVGMINEGNQLFIRSTDIIAVCLTQIDVYESSVLDWGHVEIEVNQECLIAERVY